MPRDKSLNTMQSEADLLIHLHTEGLNYIVEKLCKVKCKRKRREKQNKK